jgi:hypothetical protein
MYHTYQILYKNVSLNLCITQNIHKEINDFIYIKYIYIYLYVYVYTYICIYSETETETENK